MTQPLSGPDDAEPREWHVANRTLIVDAVDRRLLAVLSARNALLLPPGSLLHFDGVLGEQRVVGLRVISGEQGSVICVDVEPVAAAEPDPPVTWRADGKPGRAQGRAATRDRQPPQ